VKSNILFISNSTNWPLTDGKRQRTWFLLETLSEKYTVDVLLIGYQNDYDEFNLKTSSVHELFFIDISPFGLSKFSTPSYFLSKKFRIQKSQIIKKINDFFQNLYDTKKYDFLFSRYLQPLLFLNLPKDVKVICDIDDVYFEAQRSRILNEKNIKQKLKLLVLYYLLSKRIKKCLNRIDIPIVVKESDRSFYGLQKAKCLPNLPFDYFINQHNISLTDLNFKSETNFNFGFIGKLSYRPNNLGLKQFITTVWNSYIENNTESKLIIAGSGLIPEDLKETIDSSKNIFLLGFIENTELFWNEISVLIVPVAEGGGSNIKIAEAFMHGKRVIAHPFASRGYREFLETGDLILPKDTTNWITSLESIKLTKNEELGTLKKMALSYFDLFKWKQILFHAVN
jgi:hypothetical protein